MNVLRIDIRSQHRIQKDNKEFIMSDDSKYENHHYKMSSNQLKCFPESSLNIRNISFKITKFLKFVSIPGSRTRQELGVLLF